MFYHVDDSPHGDTLLMIYFPKEKILVQADLYNSAAAPPFAMNLNENIGKRKLKIEKHVPLHGEIRKQADFVKLIHPLQQKTTAN